MNLTDYVRYRYTYRNGENLWIQERSSLLDLPQYVWNVKTHGISGRKNHCVRRRPATEKALKYCVVKDTLDFRASNNRDGQLLHPRALSNANSSIYFTRIIVKYLGSNHSFAKTLSLPPQTRLRSKHFSTDHLFLYFLISIVVNHRLERP